MSGNPGPVLVRGDPVSSWLTACAIARFTGVDPSQVSVRVEASHPSKSVFVRPEMDRLHRSLGLDVSTLRGAQSAQGWRAGPKLVSMSPFGASLSGASFQNLWSRARSHGERRSLSEFQSRKTTPGTFFVPADAYGGALERIARRAGVGDGNVECVEPATVIQTEPSDERSDLTANRRNIGTAVLPIQGLGDLRAMALDLSIRALIATWPRHRAQGLEQTEYERRLTCAAPVIADMRALVLGGGDRSPSLNHRISVWRELGRITPVDDDPFTAAEWIGALLQAGHQPEGYPKLVEAIPLDTLRQHIDAHASCEVQHG